MKSHTADCTPFVKLMLEIIRDSLEEVEVVGQTDPVSDLVSDPVKKLLITLGNEELAISELMRRMGLSHKPTFRKNVESCLNNR